MALQGAFGPDRATTFGKFGERFGFSDAPLKVRDVDYERLRDRDEHKAALDALEKQRKARAAAAAASRDCSGHECTDSWGKLGVGDQVTPSSLFFGRTTSSESVHEI